MTVTWGNTTVFGGSAAPGTPAPAGGGFSFGSTPAPAPGAGGGFSFGSTTPAPATGGGLFGAPAPSTSNLFGSSSASTPAAPGGLFGASAAAPSTAFGSTPAPTPGSLFGATAPPPFAMTSTGAPVSANSSTPQAAAAYAHLHAAQRQEAAKIESALMGLHSAYTPQSTAAIDANPLHITNPSSAPPNSLCRFKYFFYDPLTAEQRQNMTLHGSHHHAVPRPSHVETHEWNDALARNPDPSNYAPVCIIGSEALAKRASEQQQRAKMYASHVAKLRSTLEEMKSGSARMSEDANRYAAREHDALRKRLLDVMRKVEIVRCMNLPLQPAERDAGDRLKLVLRQLNQVGKTMGDVEKRAQAHAQYLRSTGGAGEGGDGGGDDSNANTLTEEDKTELFTVMNEQKEGLERLVNIVKKDLRDVNILKEEVGKINMAVGGGIAGSGPLGEVVGQLPSNMGGVGMQRMGQSHLNRSGVKYI
mmetsp:Transcript_26659/g.38992  ORF Transcript_26659/g.38992 Transcript_26659/m.38992 type:complete len:475 (-) Transcript_26659:294-1718(-)